ncbi:MAG: prolipoprotein diacylglyceryl transferase [Candidatus Omnitrophica bacterium]|nr:prolipoprotein diacylglyceryl transferase [Candidatus Omnitrophota bacterium]
MLDLHTCPDNWGIRPILFDIGGIKVYSYPFFISLALIASIVVYFLQARKEKSLNEKTFLLFIAALVGGIMGSKIPVWIAHYKEIIASFPDLRVILSGRTIVGGMIGGAISVRLTKKYLGIKIRKGNIFAPAIALAIAVGRIGCFLRGCCYGSETNLAWGVDFGDGILRHPTQIYESAFALFMFFALLYLKKKITEPGALFKIFMVSYFSFRFGIEFIRVNPKLIWGLNLFQLVSILVIGYYLRELKLIFKKSEVIYG